jgi:predicted esterase
VIALLTVAVLAADPAFEDCPLGYKQLEPGACLFSPKEPVATVVYLHGMFEPGKLPARTNEFTALAEAASKKRLAVLALQGEVGLCYWSKDALRSRCWPNDLAQKDKVPALVARVQSALRQSRGVTSDLGRAWLMGFSNGGYAVAMLLSESTLDFEGYVVAHGGELTGMKYAPERMRPTLLLSAKADYMMQGSMKRLARGFDDAKWPYTFTWREGVHELNPEDAKNAVEFINAHPAKNVTTRP